jgi:hypothetical protein
MNQFNQQFITAIIDRYGLEPDDYQIDNIVVIWLKTYDRAWIFKAIIESLHRGRYKLKSVDSILSGWQRAGKPSYNFPPEFEREILQNLPTISDLAATPAPTILPPLADLEPVSRFPGLSSEQLNPEESAPFPRHDRATPILQLPTLDRGTTFPRTEIDCPTSLTPPSGSSFRGEDDVNLNHINSHSKFHLFHTLRAIIMPHNLPATGLDDLDPPSYSTDLG